jgi:8-amino-7-oxononanoate synthase
MANIGALQALVGEGDIIYSDEYNHASLIDGCRLSRADVRIFPHCDLDALAAIMANERHNYRRALIVVEGVFSMDGDLFPLDGLVHLAKRFGAWTYVDDAHGTGVVGASGRGAVEHFGVDGQIDVIVGTLGKALGTVGAYVAGSRILVELLISRARSFIFTTGTPPALAAASLEALRISEVESWRRETVRERATQLRDRLEAAAREPGGPHDGHIIPVMIGDPLRTMLLVGEMRKRGFLIGGVRPPTVPAGTSRLRISVSAMHPPELIDSLAAHLIDALRVVYG